MDRPPERCRPAGPAPRRPRHPGSRSIESSRDLDLRRQYGQHVRSPSLAESGSGAGAHPFLSTTRARVGTKPQGPGRLRRNACAPARGTIEVIRSAPEAPRALAHRRRVDRRMPDVVATRLRQSTGGLMLAPSPSKSAPLRIALVAPPMKAVPPVGYGGTERVVERSPSACMPAATTSRPSRPATRTCPAASSRSATRPSGRRATAATSPASWRWRRMPSGSMPTSST